MDQKWRQIKEELKKSLSKGQYDLWVSTLEFVRYRGRNLVVRCRNALHKDWLREKLEKVLIEIAQRHFEGIEGIEYEISEAESISEGDHEELDGPRQISFQDIVELPVSPYNPRFTFDQFVTGNCNQFAFSAALALAQDQSFHYQSMYLLSDSGLGKSHLSQAVGNHLRLEKPGMLVRYVTAEQFANEMIVSLKSGSMESFKRKYREKCDLLLMERIEFLSGKEKIQSELVYTIDELLDRGKGLICTGKAYPKDIPKLSAELHSRLNGILMAHMEQPDFQTRFEIIKRKAHYENAHLPLEVAEFLANKLTGDVRQLESCLVGVIVKSNMMRVPITLHLAQDVTQVMLSHLPKLTVEHIQKTVCSSFGVDLEEVKTKTRRKDVALARQVGMYLCRQFTSQSLSNIGKAFGRSHSSVVYSVNALGKKMKGSNNKLKRQVDYLVQKLETGCLYP
jgi:chromosomal replication initiator protein